MEKYTLIKIALISAVGTIVLVGVIVGVVIAVTDVAEETCERVGDPGNLLVTADGNKVIATWEHPDGLKNCGITYNVGIFVDGDTVMNTTTEGTSFTYGATPCTTVKFVVYSMGSNVTIEGECPTSIGTITDINIDDHTVTWNALGLCRYEVFIDDDADGVATSENSFDLSREDLKLCVDHKIGIRAVHDGVDVGETSERTFQIGIREVEDFKFQNYNATEKPLIEVSWRKVPGCSYVLRYVDNGSEPEDIAIDEAKCTTEDGKTSCGLDPTPVLSGKLTTCTTHRFTMEAYSLGEHGHRGPATAGALNVTTPGAEIEQVSVSAGVATWPHLGDACFYRIKYDDVEITEEDLSDGDGYEIKNLIHCKASSVEVLAYVSDDDEGRVQVARGTTRYTPDLVLPEINATEKDGHLYAEWTDLNSKYCSYSVRLDEAPQHTGSVRQNWWNFSTVAPEICRNYTIGVTVVSGVNHGEPLEKVYTKEPDENSVAITGVTPFIGSDSYVVVVDWSVKDNFKDCGLVYTIACSINGGFEWHTDYVTGPPFYATDCKISGYTKIFKISIQPILRTNAAKLEQYTKECDVDFKNQELKCF